MLVRQTVKVTRVISRRGGGAIIKGVTPDEQSFTVLASYVLIAGATIEKDDIWTAAGELKMHPVHGPQIHATELEFELPANDLIVDYLLNSPRFRNFGLGETKIANLWGEYGEELIGILDRGEVDRLSDVEKVSEDVAVELVSRWKTYTGEINVRKWLRDHNVPRKHARKIIKIWGDDAIQHLERDPYELARFIEPHFNFNWQDVDKLGLSLNVDIHDPRRLVGAVETALFKRLDEADTLVPHQAMIKLVEDLLDEEGDIAERAISEAEKALVLVGNSVDGYQHRGIARLERRIRDRLCNMIDSEVCSQSSLMRGLITDKAIENGIRKVEQKIEAETGKIAQLAPEQRNAVCLAVREPFGLICGGAGTGKTTILRAVHETISPQGIPIYQMALAGRAAQRMRESTGQPATTIAKFCMEVRTGKRTVEDDSLFIVDESSMVDLSTMYRLLSYVPGGARVILVGDPHQLPPVSFGLVFDKLVESSLVKKVTLREVHRQAESSGIPSVARDVREYKVPEGIQRHKEIPANLNDMPGVHFIECTNGGIESQSLRGSHEVAWNIYEGLGRDPDEIRVLGAILRANNGSWGSDDINSMLRSRLNKNFIGKTNWTFAVGEEVIFVKNDYDLGLSNGCLGTIHDLQETPEGWVMVAEWDNGEVLDIPESKFRNVKSAYAMTVHKAQGSEFKKIICPIFASRNLDNSLIYTALTRGKEQVVFFGNWADFVSAVTSTKISDERLVGFSMTA